jgi:ABC-2 type transport system permease protein
VERIPLAVVDLDHSDHSRQLAERFTSGGVFVRTGAPVTVDDAEALLRADRAKVALIIDDTYTRQMERGEPAPVQLLVDGADNTTASVAIGYAQAIAMPDLGPLLAYEVRTRALFNPGLRSAVFILPGLMVFILVMIAVMLTALTVAREYERGSMEQLFATPAQRLEIVLGKLLPYFVLGAVQVLLILTMGVTLFGLPVRGSLVLLAGVSSLFLLANLTQGLLISVVTRNQMVASQLAVVTTLLPALLLSGFVFPVSNMPLPLQVVARIFPASYLVDSLRAILLRGNGWTSVAVDSEAITAFFVVMLVITVRRFRREVGA